MAKNMKADTAPTADKSLEGWLRKAPAGNYNRGVEQAEKLKQCA
jgi:hypothetical protein